MLYLDYLRSQELYKKLAENEINSEGNLLQLTDTKTAEAQIEFIRWIFNKYQIDFVLEVGTNRGMFAYLLSHIRPYVHIKTIDINPDAEKSVNLLKDITHLEIDFICGDSVDVLSTLGEDDWFDLAWIDGHHGYEHAYSDLVNCARLEIPYIAIDDTNMDTVEKAYLDFLTLETYQEVENPFLQHDSRRARLLKRVV